MIETLKFWVIDEVLVSRNYCLLACSGKVQHENDKIRKIHFQILIFIIFPG